MTMYRYFLLSVVLFVFSMSGMAQSVDEKIGNAMNTADWFALDSIYNVTPKDSINPFLEVFSRCLIGNRLNRPEVSIPAFRELLNSQSLDLGNLVSSAHMFGMDLSREGYNAEAASMINSIVDQTRQYLDSASVAALTVSAERYAALAEYKPYEVEFPQGADAEVPFVIVPVGPEGKGSVLMHLRSSYINGIEADITFDTGAGVNMISPEMAAKYNLEPLSGTRMTVAGVGKGEGYVAVAKELKLGNLSVRNVPFIVASMSSNNAEADQYIDCFNIVVGSELMLQLKDLTIDFNAGLIAVPSQAPTRSDAAPNLCFSSGMNLLTRGAIRGRQVQMCLDSGDASFGSLGANFYEEHQQYLEAHCETDTIRSAGFGGVAMSLCYRLTDVDVTIGGTTVTPAEIVVMTRADYSAMAYGANIGLRTLMLYRKIRFNMVDFTVAVER